MRAHRQPTLWVRTLRHWRERCLLKVTGWHQVQVWVWLSPPLGPSVSLLLQGTHTAGLPEGLSQRERWRQRQLKRQQGSLPLSDPPLEGKEGAPVGG